VQAVNAQTPTAAVKRALLRLPPRARDPLIRQWRWLRGLTRLGADEEELDRRRFFHFAFWALGFNRITGDYVEFGSWSGRTFRMAYDESRHQQYRCRLWAFDSFSGLPTPRDATDQHPRWIAGDMATSLREFEALCQRHGIPRTAYRTIPGWYEDTLRNGTTGERPQDICLAYVDCDLYSSTVTVLEFLRPRLKHGMILVLDDYFAWSPDGVSGERRALSDVLAGHPDYRLVPFMRFGWASLAFTVEDRRLLSSPGPELDL
jgi:hypothetical protein